MPEAGFGVVGETLAEKRESKVYVERWLEKLAAEKADEWWRAGQTRQRSKSQVYRWAIKLALAGRIASRPIGEQLRLARKEAGLSLPQVARRTPGKALAPSVIWRIESEDRSPRLSSLEALAKALDVSIVIDPDGVAVLRRGV